MAHRRMVDVRTLLDRARTMMAVAAAADATAPGVAGLAYQAANLAMKAMLIQADGTDIWWRETRDHRLSELLGISEADLALIHHVRQLDFYADAEWGREIVMPTAEQAQRTVEIASRVVDVVGAKLRS